jgi:hypothetical protein
LSEYTRTRNCDSLRDFAAITRLTQQPRILTAQPSLSATTLKERAAYAKQNPGKVTFASKALGMTPSPTTPPEIDAQIRAYCALWGKVVKRAGVKAE